MCRMNVAALSGLEELAVCRDERCEIVGLHPPHVFDDSPRLYKQRLKTWGWAIDPFEQPKQRTPAAQPHSFDYTNRITSNSKCAALDDVIMEVVPYWSVKPTRVLYDDIVNVYGSLNPRRLHRRLAALVAGGGIVHLLFKERSELLSGYTKPGSPMLRDPERAKEIIWRQMGEAA